jgi:hypothetical protein
LPDFQFLCHRMLRQPLTDQRHLPVAGQHLVEDRSQGQSIAHRQARAADLKGSLANQPCIETIDLRLIRRADHEISQINPPGLRQTHDAEGQPQSVVVDLDGDRPRRRKLYADVFRHVFGDRDRLLFERVEQLPDQLGQRQHTF